jgi:hypothetical protein
MYTKLLITSLILSLFLSLSLTHTHTHILSRSKHLEKEILVDVFFSTGFSPNFCIYFYAFAVRVVFRDNNFPINLSHLIEEGGEYETRYRFENKHREKKCGNNRKYFCGVNKIISKFTELDENLVLVSLRRL